MRGRSGERASAEAGQAREVGWATAKALLARRGAGERAAGAVAGRAGFGRGPERRRRPVNGENLFFNFYFQEIFKYQFSNIILSKKITSFENVPKIKVA